MPLRWKPGPPLPQLLLLLGPLGPFSPRAPAGLAQADDAAELDFSTERVGRVNKEINYMIQ